MNGRVETIGDATLYLGDCREILPTLGKVDAVVTDPPYGQSETHDKHLSTVIGRSGIQMRQRLGFNGLSENDLVAIAASWLAICRGWVVFTCEWKFMSALDKAGRLVRFGVWRKPDGAPQFTGDRPGTGWEAVAICHNPGKKSWNGGGKHAFWEYPKGTNQSGHPTGKPLSLFKEFVLDFTNPGMTVLDPFMGSGTTGVACARLGRRFIGIETEPKYFDIACRRIEEAYKQPDMFVPRPEKAKQESLL